MSRRFDARLIAKEGITSIHGRSRNDSSYCRIYGKNKSILSFSIFIYLGATNAKRAQ